MIINKCAMIEFDTLLQVSGLTAGRAAALFPVALGLLSIIVGCVVLARSRNRVGFGRSGAVTALLSGSIGLIWSVTHLVRTSGSSIGTGSGRLGAFVALVLSIIGILLGGLALARANKKHLD